MRPMRVPVLRVLCGQSFVADDEHVLRVLLLRRLGESETPCDDGFAVDNDDLIMSDGMRGINRRRYPWLARKSAEEYCSVRWLLSTITCICTPRLWASSSALAIGAEVKA
jgi:hypothetical protein